MREGRVGHPMMVAATVGGAETASGGRTTPKGRTGAGPLFQRIAVALRDRVVSGQLGAGARLPSEADICLDWGVSRITAKRALDALAAEGLVTRARGRGTIVTARVLSPSGPTRLAGWRESLARMAEATTVSVLSFDYLPAPGHVARELELSVGAEVQRVRRLRLLDGRPMSHLESWVPAEFGRVYDAPALLGAPMLHLLERNGLRVCAARQSIGATSAPPEVADALGVPAGAPLLDLRRRLSDRQGRPIQILRALYRPDLYRYEMELPCADVAPETRRAEVETLA